MEHIVDRENAVRKMLQVLSPGGLLINTTVVPEPLQLPDAIVRICSTSVDPILRRRSQNGSSFGAQLKRREMWRLFSGVVWATGDRIASQKCNRKTRRTSRVFQV